MLTYTYISNNLQKSSKNKKNVIGEKNKKTHSFSCLQTIPPPAPRFLHIDGARVFVQILLIYLLLFILKLLDKNFK